MRLPSPSTALRLRRLSSTEASAMPTRPISASSDIFEGIKAKIERKSGIRDWLRDMQARMEGQPTGPFLLGGDRPFAHNPVFQARPPITNALRTRLYQLHLGDPEEWTPRRLSAQFKVAIPRVKAVIRMKELEDGMLASGKLTLDEGYVGRMEEHLGAKVPVQVEMDRDNGGHRSNNSLAEHLRPMFVAMPETAPALSYADAAQLLGRTPIQRGSAKEEKNSDPTKAEPIHPTSPHGQFIRFDPYERARGRFLFVDMTPGVRPRGRQLLVREANGDLRTGTGTERLLVARRVWGRSARHHLK